VQGRADWCLPVNTVSLCGCLLPGPPASYDAPHEALSQASLIRRSHTMKLSLSPSLQTHPQETLDFDALRSWYDGKPSVRRLWAIRPEEDSEATGLRVILMLEPSPDGNDPSPRWMAHGPQWAMELTERLSGTVQLERIDGPLPDEFEIEGEGVLLSALSWRDPTLLQD